jgi:signal peptidase I
MFERFTEAGIKTIMLAQEEARRLGHNFVGTEMILMGLVGEGQGIAARSLQSAGVSLKASRIEVEKIIGRGSGFVSTEIPFTPRSKRTLEMSWDEARRLGHNYIGTEHLLLGLIREGDGVGIRVLANLQVDTIKLRNHVIASIPGLKGYIAPEEAMPPEPKVPNDTAELNADVSVWYTQEAILTIQRAWGIAETIGNKSITNDHLLLALLRDNDTIFSALQATGLDLGKLRQEVFKVLQPEDGCQAKSIPFSPEAQKSLEYAWLQAVELDLGRVTKECLFLGLLRQEDSLFIQVLKNLGIEPDTLRKSVHDGIKAAKEKKVTEAKTEAQQASAGGAGTKQILDIEHPEVTRRIKRLAKIKRTLGIVALAAVVLWVILLSGGIYQINDEGLSSVVSLSNWAFLTFTICAIAYLCIPSGGGRTAKQLRLFPLHNPDVRPLTGMIIFWPLILIYGIILFYFSYSPEISGAALFGLLFAIVLFPLIVIVFPSFPILGESMMPTLLPGDGVLAERLSRLLGRPFERGDLIIFRANSQSVAFIPPAVREKLEEFSSALHRKLGIFNFCKRIVGLPGETIEIFDGSLHVNGQALKESWASGFDYSLRKMSDIGHLGYHPFPNQDEPIVVPPGSYFVLGDKKACANIDSHVFGFVTKKSIWGRLVYVFWREGAFKWIKF